MADLEEERFRQKCYTWNLHGEGRTGARNSNVGIYGNC